MSGEADSVGQDGSGNRLHHNNNGNSCDIYTVEISLTKLFKEITLC